MKKNTFNNKIFKLTASLVFITTLMLLAAVWNSTGSSVVSNVQDRLELAETVVIRELISKQQVLVQNTNMIVDDYAFKRAVLTRDVNYLNAAIQNYADIIYANFVSIVEPNGNIVAHVGEFATLLDQEMNQKHMALALMDGDSSNLVVIDNVLTWVVWLPIKNSEKEINEYAIMGFVVSGPYLEGLKRLVNVEVSALVQTDTPFVVSTITSTTPTIKDMERSLIADNTSTFLAFNPFTTDDTFLSRKFNAAQGGDVSATVYLSISANELKKEFLHLQLTIGAVTFLGMIIALIAARAVSKQITQPLEFIAKHAVNISKGEYSKHDKLHTSTVELEELLGAFQTMEEGVQRREKEIVFQAEHDMLTRLYNRNYIKSVIDNLFDSHQNFQVIGINILGFRGINDIFGYKYGDLCLQELARRVAMLPGKAARLTGGEILYVPTAIMSEDEALAMKAGLEGDIITDGFTLPMKTAVGILNCPKDTDNAEDLFRRMNIVIDQAQTNRSYLMQFDVTIEDKYLRRLAIVNRLRNALLSDSQELDLHYQAKLGLQTNQVQHVEALVRWNDTELGSISPDEFITVAEHAGIIGTVTQWVLKRAVRDVIQFKAQGIDVCVAVNISAQDLLSDKFMKFARELLDENQLDHKAISFELTEGVIVRDPKKAIEHMQILRNDGFLLALDDFGTGYSSLSYLTQLPIDILKIDKSFVMPLAESHSEQSICKTVISLAKAFNMKVVAEGVEDQASQNMLTEWGCDYAQGYHIQRPSTADAFVNWVNERNVEA